MVLRLVSDVRTYLKTALALGDSQVTTVPLVDAQARDPQPTIVIVRSFGGPGMDGDLDPRRLQAEVVAERADDARQMMDRLVTAMNAYPNGSARINMLPQDGSYQFAGGVEKPWAFCDFFIMVPTDGTGM